MKRTAQTPQGDDCPPQKVPSRTSSACLSSFCEGREELHVKMHSDHASPVCSDLTLEDAFAGKCPDHPDEMLDYLCCTHDVLCCAKCKLSGGGAHTTCTVVPIEESICNELSAVTDSLKKSVHAIKVDKLNALKTKRSELEKRVNDAKQSVANAFKEIHENVNKQEKKLMDRLDEVYKEWSNDEMISWIESSNMGNDALDNLNKVYKVQNTLETRNIMNCISKAKKIDKAIEEDIEKIDEALSFDNIITFERNEDILGQLGNIGRIIQKGEYPSGWKEPPHDVDDNRRYSIDRKNPRIATKAIYGDSYCTIIGKTAIPLNTVISWNIKVLKSKSNSGDGICIGIAPSDINQNEERNYNKCGWYFYYYISTLWSGPPHNYRGKVYGPRKEKGEYVHAGDSVCVVMDTTRGDLSFVLDGVNLGVAYGGIPLDKPLVPCVLLRYEGDSVELDPSKAKKSEVDISVPVPSDIIVKGITWGSIALTWDKVTDASFYQVEVDGSKSWDATTTNLFAKRGLLPDTEHSFRVRTVRGSSVGKWSGVVEGRTLKFSGCAWKECPDYVDKKRKYNVDERNHRTATKVNNDSDCTIIGNMTIPPNTVTSWSIKLYESRDNDGGYILIGVAPPDIDQNTNDNFDNCGWYFYCYDSTLYSGPPHSYRGEEYGPRKEYHGEYVHTGGSVGVVVDTTKGELSFVLDGVNLGVAFEEIPLDKPLVPCVILGYQGDSVELDTSDVKENVNSSIPVPSNITTKSEATWGSITLTWDEVEDASFYQIEVDGSISCDMSTTNSSTKEGLLPETEHSFRVRTVGESSVSEWSGVVKGRTLNFSDCMWRECPDDIDKKKKYSVDGGNPRVATKNNDGSWLLNYGYCTIIGNRYIPLNAATSWDIKVLKSKNNNGSGIYIGIAPNDIDQNNGVNYNKCGWYFDCYSSKLRSGLPHNYRNKVYGPRKEDGQYVHTGDSVGVVMDTTKGELSFFLKGKNLGVAYSGIPLDKPLVPCILLWYEGDSVELVTPRSTQQSDDESPCHIQ